MIAVSLLGKISESCWYFFNTAETFRLSLYDLLQNVRLNSPFSLTDWLFILFIFSLYKKERNLRITMWDVKTEDLRLDKVQWNSLVVPTVIRLGYYHLPDVHVRIIRLVTIYKTLPQA